MAGGLPGTHRPFSFNVKCIIFTLMVTATWKLLPQQGVWPWLVVLWWPYVAMAWYDYMYKCQDKLQPTALPFGRMFFLPFKPPDYQKAYDELPVESKQIMDGVDHTALWIVVTASAVFLFFFLKRS